MYLEFYNLKEKPFSLTPDPAFLYYSEAHKRAIAFLKYGLQESKGFLQLTGPVGSGKTTLLRAILAECDENTRTAYIINPTASFPDLLRSIMKDLEIPNIPQTRLKIELLDFFHDYLLVQMRRSNQVIIIFDEAQNLSLKNLEEIRMLSNFETTKGKLLQIVLVGQPELVKTLARPELRQLKQRIQVRYHLRALDLPEVKAYIHHRLQIAGSDGAINFTNESCKKIYEFSGGIPRLINSVCDIALLIGYVSDRKKFTPSIIREAIKELGGSFSGKPFDAEEEDASLEEHREAQDRAGSPLHEKNTRAPDEMPSLDADRKDASPVIMDKGSESVRHISGPDPDDPTDPRRRPECVAGDMSKREALIEECCSSPDAPDAREMRPEKCDVNRSADTPDEADTRKSSVLPSAGVAVNTPRRTSTGFLHSILRHGTTGKFRVAGSGVIGSVWPENGVRTITKKIAAKILAGRNGDIGLRTETTNDKFPAEPQPGKTRKEHEAFAPPSISEKTRASSHLSEPSNAPRKKTGAKRSRRGRPLGRRDYRPPKHSVNVNVEVLFKDGKTLLGTTKNIDVKRTGFYLSLTRPHNDVKERFVAFELTLGLRFLESFEKGWKKKCRVTNSQPKGRQIIATLVNGEVVEGITPGKFDPTCQRFFVLSAANDGNVSWMLVERTGTAGIHTESFKEGIYAEETETFDYLPESPGIEEERSCQYESTGDFYFSIQDYDSALSEYRKAQKNGACSERLELKISLSHLNRGIDYMKKNRYLDAKSEFEKVTVDPRLRERARIRAERIEKMLRP